MEKEKYFKYLKKNYDLEKFIEDNFKDTLIHYSIIDLFIFEINKKNIIFYSTLSQLESETKNKHNFKCEIFNEKEALYTFSLKKFKRLIKDYEYLKKQKRAKLVNVRFTNDKGKAVSFKTNKRKIEIKLSSKSKKELDKLKKDSQLNFLSNSIRSCLPKKEFIKLEKEAGNEILYEKGINKIVRDSMKHNAEFVKSLARGD